MPGQAGFENLGILIVRAYQWKLIQIIRRYRFEEYSRK
jgi:hypothetical protein